MKKKICLGLLAFICVLSAMLSGCGGSRFRDSIRKKGDEDSSFEVAEESSSEPEESSSLLSPLLADESSQVFDEIVVNEEVSQAVEERTAEYYDIEGWYGFTVDDFDMVYSNKELQKCFDRLQEICDTSYFPMAFSFKNINTGAYVGYNQYNRFMTCSTVKAPLVKSLLANGIDLDAEVQRTYTWEGDYDGSVAQSAYGTVYTVKELIEYTILESDNTAYYMLCRNFGTDAFNRRQYELGANYTLGYYGEWIFTYCTSDDMMKDYEDIYRFAEENEQGHWLVDLLCNAKLNIQIGQALGSKYPVAQKYGSEFGEVVFNDCAIVYAESPFVLCIFTNQYPETEESCKVFRELALVFDDINSLIADESVDGATVNSDDHEVDNDTEPANTVS